MQLFKNKSIALILLLHLFITGINVSAYAATVTWSGGGTDSLASNPLNWSGGITPQYGDDVIFDVASSKDCTWDYSITLSSLSINSGYTGSVTLSSSADLHISDNITAPAAPSDLTAAAVSSSRIDLSWTDNSDNESGFRIERKTGAGGTYLEIESVETNVTTYSDTDPLLIPDTTYYYRVNAFNLIGNSGYSNEDSDITFSEDNDGDGIENALDNCPSISNNDQLDADGDNIGNVCDTCTDSDRDGYGNPGYPSNTCQNDNCPIISNANQLDLDGDGMGYACDDSVDLLNQSTYVTGLKNMTDDAVYIADVSSVMLDGLFTDSRRVQRSKGNYSVLSFRSDIEAAELASVTLKVYISDLDNGTAEQARVYAYYSDGNSVYTSFARVFILSPGWNDLDVTDLITVMQGYGFVKFRIVPLAGWFDVAEAQISGTSDRGLDDWDISVNPMLIDFGTVETGGYTWHDMTISNIGTGDLIIGSIVAPPSPFNILSDKCSGQTLSDSQDCSLILTFTPGLGGTYTDTLIIPSNDGDNPDIAVSLAGESVQPASIQGTVTDKITGLQLSDVVVTVMQIRNINLSPSDAHHTYGKLTYLPSDDTDLSPYTGLHPFEEPHESYRYNDGEKVAVANEWFGDKYCINLFKFRNPFHNTDAFKVTWNGVSGGSGYEFYAQSFQPEIAGPLTKISLYLRRPVSGTSGYLTVYLKSALGSELDNVLAVSDIIPMNEISTEYSWTDFYFSNPVFLNKDQTYYFEVKKPGGSGFSVKMGAGTTLSYNRGQNYRRDYGAWKSYFQLLFKTYINDSIDQQQTAYYREEILSGFYDKSVTSQIYNKSTNSWQGLNSKNSSGGYDFDIENKIATNLNNYYDNDGWVSVRVISIYDSFVSLATDLYQAEFEGLETTITDSNGQYTMSGLNSGDYTVVYEKPGYENLEVSGTLSPGEIRTLDVQMSLLPLATLTGTVTSTVSGSPLSGVTVTVHDPVTTLSTITDSNGTYTITGLTSGDYSATFEKSAYIEQTVNGTLTVGQTETLDIQLHPAQALTVNISSPSDGTVLNVSPTTVTGTVTNSAEVSVNGVQATVTSDMFSVSIPLSEGQNTITATAIDQYDQTASDNIAVTLVTKGSISGTVTDLMTGLALPSATVSVTDFLNVTQTVLTDIDGKYSIYDIAPGDFSGEISKAGYTPFNISDTISAGQAMTIDTALNPVLPVISNIAVSNITNNSATITWTTDQLSDSSVDYGLTASYESSVSDSALTTSHSITLMNLITGMQYHFMVTSTNEYGFTSSSGDNTFTTLTPITLTLTSPLDSASINRPDVMVRGTVSNSTGNETGVTVNGIVAIVYNGEFFVNHVPLEEGQNTITVSATDTAGNTAFYSVTVTAVTTLPHVTLRDNIESGIAPLMTYFSVSTSIPDSVSNYAIDYEGDAIADYSGITFDDISFTYTADGVYYPTLTITDDQSNIYSDSIAVVVLNKTDLDALLQAKWDGMKAALMSGDINRALDFFVEESKSRYDAIFSQMSSTDIDSVFSNINELRIYSIKGKAAQCGAIRVESGGIYAYPVTFVRDEYGVWKIMGF